MSQTIRAFIGVPVSHPAALKPVLASLGEMGRAVRPVPPENVHVTLKFLGDVPIEQTADIAAAITEAAAGIATFESEVRGLGAFPHPGRPSIVWAGVLEQEPWVALAKAIDRSLRALGFPKDRRPFHPHATLARVRHRPPAELRTLLEEHAGTHFARLNVDAVVLYQSELSPGGSRYTPLAAARLSS